MSKIDISVYLPNYYDDIKEATDLMELENGLLENVKNLLDKVLHNQFVLTADHVGLTYYESLLRIMPNPSDTLEYRRQRVLNRMTIKPPFTFRFLQKKLDELIGIGQWTAYVDYDAYTLYVETKIKNQFWLEELTVTINRIKPCNIVFVNRPVYPSSINVGEQVNLKQEEFNYRLGSKWILGVKPFRSINEKGVIKMPNESSISEFTLNSLAKHLLSNIDKVRLNNTALIDVWELHHVNEYTVEVEYRVDLSHNLGSIHKVELLDSSQNVLSTMTVYVPVLEPVLLKHMIRIKEG